MALNVLRNPLSKVGAIGSLALCVLIAWAITSRQDTTPSGLQRALDDFQTAVDGRWSYRHANGADFHGAIAALRAKVDAGISPNDFGIELQKIIALGIDGHAGVTGYSLPSARYLPFLVEPEGDRFVAFKANRSGLLNDELPYLKSIDGNDVADWLDVAGDLVPQGSPQYTRWQRLERLLDLDYLRAVAGRPIAESVEIELGSADDATVTSLSLPMAVQRPTYGVWPPGGSRLLEENIGYLRLPSMSNQAVKEIEEWMPRFSDTDGLIVDVRGNTGGRRAALRTLYSYLADEDDPPRVFNAAAYRLHPAHAYDHLATPRFLYRAEAPEWTVAERRAIAEFAKTFDPVWRLPENQFSDWHYMVLSRLDDSRVYEMPVVILMNAKCFSATDIFLAGLKGVGNVTLMGTPSGGGSASTQRVNLGKTPFRLHIASMASFQSDGRLFDGNGVSPDIVVQPAPEYHVGGRDISMEAAIKHVADAS